MGYGTCDTCGREIKNYGVFLHGVRCPNYCGVIATEGKASDLTCVPSAANVKTNSECGKCRQPLEEWESEICEGCGMQGNLTKFQLEIINYLRRGGKLQQSISGWHYKGRLLRVETEDALKRSGCVKVIAIQGKRMVSQYVVHTCCDSKGIG